MPKIFDATPPLLRSKMIPNKLEIAANMIAIIEIVTVVL